MLKPFINFCIMLLLCLPFAVDADSAAAQLSAELKQFQTYRANFQQTVFDSRGREISHTNGKVMMKRPGRFRWETFQPSHQIVMTNGKLLWDYNVDLMQATERQLQGGAGLNAASLLTGNSEALLKNFNVTPIHQSGTGNYFKLTPKQKNNNFSYVTLGFNAKQQLISMQILNNLDQVNHFSFHDIQINQALSDSLFNFKAPAGVDVVKQ